MTSLRIASWNLRTFGDPLPMEVALREIARIIVEELKADIVCLQEIQCGAAVTPSIDCPIDPAIVQGLDMLLTLLRVGDPEGNWEYRVSGVNNSGRAGSMRDAYAFFWKVTPGASALSHANAPMLVTLIQGPNILRLWTRNGDIFPGRRPGMAAFEITSQADQPPVPLNLVTIHAATPCNTVGKAKNGVSSGRAIFALAKLPDIGGTLRTGTTGGYGYQWIDGAALPQVDTIFLGDCNYAMDASGAQDVYRNLTTNYQPCVSTFDNPVRTTYSSNPTQPFSGVSSYDNIFVLRKHKDFTPSITFDGTAGAFDFIADQAKKLGGASGIRYFADDAAWYVCYLDNYRRQCNLPGISDHLPVVAQFDVGKGLADSQRVRPTSGTNNNCLFHATFGAPGMDGCYVDDQAVDHRNTFVNYAHQAIATNFNGAVRTAILSTMINEFDQSPNWLDAAQYLLTDPTIDPLQDAALKPEWEGMATAYLQGILNGRMLYVHEAEMLAIFWNITLRLHFGGNGAMQVQTLNDGHAVTDIYHFGFHFFRFNPN